MPHSPVDLAEVNLSGGRHGHKHHIPWFLLLVLSQGQSLCSYPATIRAGLRDKIRDVATIVDEGMLRRVKYGKWLSSDTTCAASLEEATSSTFEKDSWRFDY
jgi:hypothetical protein